MEAGTLAKFHTWSSWRQPKRVHLLVEAKTFVVHQESPFFRQECTSQLSLTALLLLYYRDVDVDEFLGLVALTLNGTDEDQIRGTCFT